jgi:hypothetical protein
LVYQLIHEYGLSGDQDGRISSTSAKRWPSAFPQLQDPRTIVRNMEIYHEDPHCCSRLGHSLIAGPTFAQSASTGEHQPVYNASPASPDFGDNGN